MKLKIYEHDNATVLSLGGKFLGALDGEAYKQAIEQLKEQDKTCLVIDLAEAEMMDSTAIGILTGSLTTMRKAGGDVRLANLKKRLRNVFLMTRLLGTVFEDFDSLDIALRSYRDFPEPVNLA